jgi:hypothetical protein
MFMIATIPVLLYVWGMGWWQFPLTVLHEWGHGLFSGNLLNHMWISADGREGLSWNSFNLFGDAMQSAGGYGGALLGCILLQLIPNGVVKGFSVAAFIVIFGTIGDWRNTGYVIDFRTPGALDIALGSRFIMAPLMVIMVPMAWILNMYLHSRKIEKKAAKARAEKLIEQKTKARLNRLKTA